MSDSKSRVDFDSSVSYFSFLLEEFRKSDSHSLSTELFTIRLGNPVIRLHFAGNALVNKIIPAFKHVLVDATEVDLDVFLLDSKSTKLSIPKPPWQEKEDLAFGEMWINDSDELKVKHQPTKNLLMMLNLKSSEAIYWVKDAEEVPYYDSSAPIRLILHWWMSSVGNQLLHAAAVGFADKGILLTGKGGSGKSNTAISCLNSDLLYASDDYCLLSFDDEPVAHSLFSTAKLHFEDVEKYPFLKSCLYNAQGNEKLDEKALFFLYPEFKERITESFPIKAIFVPRVSNLENACITELTSSQAYLALAPSTIFQMHGNRVQTHDNISKLVKQLPCYELALSVNSEKNSEAISNFLKELGD